MCKMPAFLTWSAVLCMGQAAVLDPSLYLSPNPPLSGEPEALDQWSRVETTSTETATEVLENIDSIREEPEVPQARTFWPIQRHYGIRGIHIPLTFSLTGTYGTNSGISSGVIGSAYGTNTAIQGVVGSSLGANMPIRGVIGSSYASVSEDSPFARSGLAGSSYGSGPGTRIYSGSGGAAWSGWGNGKWGHYGKG